MLDRMNKRITLDEGRRIVKRIHQAGLGLTSGFMIGYPGETAETVDDTIAFAKELIMPANNSYVTPFPGAPIYDWALKNGRITDQVDYLNRLGAFTKLQVNLTNLPDRELEELYDTARKSMNENFSRSSEDAQLGLLKRKGVKSLAVYGMSDLGRRLVRKAQAIHFEKVEAYDTDPKLHNTEIEKVIVKGPAELPAQEPQVVLIAVPRAADEILQELEDLMSSTDTIILKYISSWRGLHAFLRKWEDLIDRKLRRA
jgi:radical SAM superfamily enzyme YgiQ (UPF0313 family)